MPRPPRASIKDQRTASALRLYNVVETLHSIPEGGIPTIHWANLHGEGRGGGGRQKKIRGTAQICDLTTLIRLRH